MKTLRACSSLFSIRWFIIPAAVFVFYPVLNLSVVIDDIDIFSILKMTETQHVWIRFGALLYRCMQPYYYRPLCAPVFLLSGVAFGPTPIPLRLTMLLLHIATIWCIYGVARGLSHKESVASVACCIYAFSRIHWTTLSMFTNFGQSAAHALFWAALWMYIKSMAKAAKPWMSVCVLALITLGVFFKEDVIAFPIFAVAASLLKEKNGDNKRLWSSVFVFSIWAVFYLGFRHILLSVSPLSPDNYYKFEMSWRGIWNGCVKALEILSGSFLPIAPSESIWLQFFQFYRVNPLIAGIWVVSAIVLGVGLGHSLWAALRRDSGPKNEAGISLFRLGIFSLIGFVAGLLPYAMFKGALAPWDAHRLALSCGALSIGLASALLAVIAHLRPVKEIISSAVGIGAALLFVATALFIRYPDWRYGPFARMKWICETQQTISAVRDAVAGSLQDGDELVFVGFVPVLRIPQLFQALEHKSIVVRTQMKRHPPVGHTRWIIQKSASIDDTVRVIATRDQGGLR